MSPKQNTSDSRPSDGHKYYDRPHVTFILSTLPSFPTTASLSAFCLAAACNIHRWYFIQAELLIKLDTKLSTNYVYLSFFRTAITPDEYSLLTGIPSDLPWKTCPSSKSPVPFLSHPPKEIKQKAF